MRAFLQSRYVPFVFPVGVIASRSKKLASETKLAGLLTEKPITPAAVTAVKAAETELEEANAGLAAAEKVEEDLGKKPINDPQANLRASRLFEGQAQNAVRTLNETVIQTQKAKGPFVDLGFDFVSFTGEGKAAKLFIDEAKNYGGRVGTRKFSPFGLGPNAAGEGPEKGIATLTNSINLAIEAIEKADITRATKKALISQLKDRTATVRILGRAETRVSDAVREAITAKSGFKVLPGIEVVP